ncbi:hypothetical protein Q7C36_015092 [Tachysurus vachellii]|uniref:Uncharacterized protein n=1 Tax=Tachysurus vachellii TaxID=175792 RepID=A0AA88SK01_TACVA|nr:hypothetical protein Q7C36_015092 [Tachysurus vachellii]
MRNSVHKLLTNYIHLASKTEAVFEMNVFDGGQLGISDVLFTTHWMAFWLETEQLLYHTERMLVSMFSKLFSLFRAARWKALPKFVLD